MGMNNFASDNQSNIVSDNDNVVKAIGELRNDMSVLANTMSKLKIVMDTWLISWSISRSFGFFFWATSNL